MSATIEKPIRDREVKADDQNTFTNREEIPFLRQVRQALNQVYRTTATISTVGDGAFTTIWTSDDVPSGVQLLVETYWEARKGTAARSAWIERDFYYSNGTLTQEGAPVPVYTQTVAGFAIGINIVGNHLVAKVQDDGAGAAVSWKFWVSAWEFQP